jgi:hypothetical protein
MGIPIGVSLPVSVALFIVQWLLIWISGIGGEAGVDGNYCHRAGGRLLICKRVDYVFVWQRI